MSKVKSEQEQKEERKSITPEIKQDILDGKCFIWIWALIKGDKKPIQIAFPGKATLKKNRHGEYFEVVNAEDKFYMREYGYFWFVTYRKRPTNKKA